LYVHVTSLIAVSTTKVFPVISVVRQLHSSSVLQCVIFHLNRKLRLSTNSDNCWSYQYISKRSPYQCLRLTSQVLRKKPSHNQSTKPSELQLRLGKLSGLLLWWNATTAIVSLNRISQLLSVMDGGGPLRRSYWICIEVLDVLHSSNC
jgi:hypothetical protein